MLTHTPAHRQTHTDGTQETGVIYLILSSSESVAVISDDILVINSIYIQLNNSNKISTGTHILVIESARPRDCAPVYVRFAS